MERVIKLTAVIVALFYATTSFATIYPIINASEEKKLTVDLNDWADVDVNVMIRDMKGEILHNDDFASGTITKRKYDLGNLPNGEYKLIIAGNNKKAITSFLLNSGKVKVLNDKTKFVYKPAFIVTEDYINVNYLPLKEKVTFSISDDRGVFFTKDYKDQDTIHKSFDIRNLPKGEYFFTLSTDNQFESIVFQRK